MEKDQLFLSEELSTKHIAGRAAPYSIRTTGPWNKTRTKIYSFDFHHFFSSEIEFAVERKAYVVKSTLS
jgi:hypothetical protein